jgi:ribosome-associated protein
MRCWTTPRGSTRTSSPTIRGPKVGTQDDRAVSGAENALRVSPTVRIPLDELQWRFSGSGGPGGQHANTSNTRVELVFDVFASRSLGPRQRARILDRLGSTVRVVVSDTRSQARNRELALERLRSRLAAALKLERRRRPTAPTGVSQQRRLEEKRRRSEVKRQRSAPSTDE